MSLGITVDILAVCVAAKDGMEGHGERGKR